MTFLLGTRALGLLWGCLAVLACVLVVSGGRDGIYKGIGSFGERKGLEEGARLIEHQHVLGVQERGTTEKEQRQEAHKGVQSLLDDPAATVNPSEELRHALSTLQSRHFQLWLGTWPESIDWTGAVMGTFLSASLESLSMFFEYAYPSANLDDTLRVENEINQYFSQTQAYYFGQNAFALRTQAYDDMLWVVLGWLESVKFINQHSKSHYPGTSNQRNGWHGEQFIPAFSHRARIFYDLASRGWDTVLCGGGMLWNPNLLPYKNAITNQLFISASVSMYLYFPGDANSSPFLTQTGGERIDSPPASEPHDPKHLAAAVRGYSWLKSSNMTNSQGLYVDGFHISNYGRNHTIGSGKCDQRNEMVYTYNQGVLLSGLRGLWESTGQLFYLTDGHQLVHNVINATGWEVTDSGIKPKEAGTWAGLGRNGILEEFCDHLGTCSQDGQTFKGIFFHHLTLFCEPLPEKPLIPGKSFSADPALRGLHAQSCKEYRPWVEHNARAALMTRDGNGSFGMWWGQQGEKNDAQLPPGAKDWRNNDTILEEDFSMTKRFRPEVRFGGDANDRGRGRTVETQGGGVSVIRALWAFALKL